MYDKQKNCTLTTLKLQKQSRCKKCIAKNFAKLTRKHRGRQRENSVEGGELQYYEK